jgi:RNA 3'-terminal phosphate cyclase (GTP)
MIDIDGAHGEGGGAILRQALGMAVYSGQPIRVFNIRARRDKPGLAAQHLKALEAAGAVCGAKVRGASPGSTEITFEPGPLRSWTWDFDIGTAGSTTLLLQAVLLPCLCHPGEYEFRLIGGSDVPWSPPAEYLNWVTFQALRSFGASALSVRRRGYYPKGGGRTLARLACTNGGIEAPMELVSAGEAKTIRGVSHASMLLKDRNIAERQVDAADHMLTRLGCPVKIDVSYSNSASPGSGITLWTESDDGVPLGGSALGAPGKPADEVGREAARELMGAMDSGAATDRYLADQLIPFLAVRGGTLNVPEITSHVRSNIYVAEKILSASFEIEGTTVRSVR